MTLKQQTADEPAYSFVLPAFNEVGNVGPMTARLVNVGTKLGRFEILWVDDGSTDGTAEALDALAQHHDCVRVLHFSRNFGHMAALCAGLEHARGSEAIITLDADGQHPPELIPALVAKWRAGADIVQTIRRDTVGASPYKRVTSGLYYWLLNTLGEIRVPPGAADFRLLDRQVVDVICSLPEREKFMRGLMFWVGFRTAYFPYRAPQRLSGTTKYSFLKMLLLGLSGITSFSSYPLRLAFMLALVILLLACIYGVYILICYAVGVPLVPGWTSLLLVVLILSGIQLLTVAIASEYLGRIYAEVKGRPNFVIRRSRRGQNEEV